MTYSHMVLTWRLPSLALLLLVFSFFSFGLNFAELKWEGEGLPTSRIQGQQGPNG